MTQFARPASTVLLGNHTVQGAATAHEATDESTVDTNDYVESPTAPVNEAFRVKLSAVTDPGVHTGHEVRIWFAKTLAGGARIDALVEVFDTSVTPNVLIVSQTFTNISETPTEYVITLTDSQAAAYSAAAYAGAIDIRITANQV